METPPTPHACVVQAEVCDGVDNDCDGAVDEGVGTRFWRDADGDGTGDPRVPLLTCQAPPDYVANATDCDDANAEVHPARPEQCNGVDDDCDGRVDDDPVDVLPSFADDDGDGHGDPASFDVTCDTQGRVESGDDCDDTETAVSPSAAEVCNGLDDDCDGEVDDTPIDAQLRYPDQDGDGYGSMVGVPVCPTAPGFLEVSGDCDDTDALVSPDGVETAVDGVDSDCNGQELCFVDSDFDGVGTDTLTPSSDLTCTSFGVAQTSGDCDDANPTRSPNTIEVCGNSIDDDCDPATLDIGDNDADGLDCFLDCDDTAPPSGDIVFENIAAAAGVDVLHGLEPFPCSSEDFAGGAAIADFDGDGDDDLFLPRLYLPDLLFQNEGDGTFTDVTAAWGIPTESRSSASAVFFDADGDADLDLFVTTTGQDVHRLYIQEAGTFSEEAALRGVAASAPNDICQYSYSVSAADVDGDGDLDLHVTGWQIPVLAVPSDRDALFINDGTGSFIESAALDLTGQASFTSNWADFDDDGDLDVAVASDWGRSTFWRNDGALTFTDVTATSGVGTDENGMGSALGDIDGDGDLDWFVASIFDDTVPCPLVWGCTGNRMYRNDGGLVFTDVTDAAGVRDAGWGWGSVFFDYDNDGDLDLAVENGFKDVFGSDFTRLWENDGTGSFVDVACETGLARPGLGRSAIPFDADLDGDQDLIVIRAEVPVALFESSGAEGQSWLTLALEQAGPNAHAIGATVWLTPTAGAAEIRRDVHLNSTYGSTAPAVAHFGLSSHAGPVHQIRIVWPDGTQETLNDVPANQRTTLVRSVP